MEIKEIKELTDKVNKEWGELKTQLMGRVEEEVKKFGTTLGDTTVKVDSITKKLDDLELKWQRAAMFREAQKFDKPKSESYPIFLKALRLGPQSLTPAESQKLLTAVDATSGNFAANPEFDAEIIKGIVEISPVRSIVRIRNTSKRSVKVMKRTGTFAAQWVAEVATRTETTGLAYGLEEIPTHEIFAMVDISRQDLEDLDFDLESELRGEFSEQFALAEGNAVLTGDGNGKPEGLMTNAAIALDNSGDANNLTYDGLVDVSHNGKEPYLANARFIWNLKTLGAIRKIKDGNGDPIWAPMAANAPATVLGFPYTIVQGMAAVAASNKPVAFGDFQRAYRLVDRVNLELQRDEVTQANKGAIRFYARKRLGGQVVLAEAVRINRIQ